MVSKKVNKQAFLFVCFSAHLGLFKLLVIICLQFDQRAKDVLILVGIFIAEQHVLGLFVHTRLLQILKGCSWILLQTKDQNVWM